MLATLVTLILILVFVLACRLVLIVLTLYELDEFQTGAVS
jgi:hypothetical protein